MGAHHHHHHHHHHNFKLDSQSSIKRIRTAFILNMLFAIIELIGGILSGSFAIVADAIHDFGDSLSLALALFLQKKSDLGPSPELTYGYRRYSILSSLISGLIIVIGSIIIIIEAIPRLFGPPSIPHVPSMIGLALLGITVNGLAAFGLSRGHSHNEKILSWHLIEDFLGWVAVLVGALCIYFFQLAWLDPLLAIAIALFILWNVIKNLKDPIRIILQFVPSEGDLNELKAAVKKMGGVVDILDWHAWTLDGCEHVLTMRLHVKEQNPEALSALKQSIRLLARDKAYHFINIELEHRLTQYKAHDHALCTHSHHE